MTDEKTSLKTIIGEKLLNKIQGAYLKYLESSAAIYEINGDYAAALFSSRYCDFLNQASRNLAGKTDGEALKSGRWICHKDCWAASLKSIKDKKPCEIECSGGIKIYAAPIMANDTVIGSNNAGVSNPPTDEKKIKEIADKYKVDPNELLSIAKEYIQRPEYVLNAAKNHILTAAEEISEIFMRKHAEEEIVLRKNAEGIIKRNEAQYKMLMETMNEGLSCVDENGVFIYGNNKFYQMMECDFEVIGKSWTTVFDKKAQAIIEEQLVERKKGSSKPYELEIIKKDNKKMFLRLSPKPLFDENGNYKGSMAVITDITEQKSMEEKLKKSYAELEKKIEELERFRRATVDREFRIKELNDEIERLNAEK